MCRVGVVGGVVVVLGGVVLKVYCAKCKVVLVVDGVVSIVSVIVVVVITKVSLLLVVFGRVEGEVNFVLDYIVYIVIEVNSIVVEVVRGSSISR